MNCSVECKCSRRWMVFADGHTQIAQVIWVWLILPIGNLNTSLLHLAFGSYFDMLSGLSTCSSSQTSNTQTYNSLWLLFPFISPNFSSVSRVPWTLCSPRLREFWRACNSAERRCSQSFLTGATPTPREPLGQLPVTRNAALVDGMCMCHISFITRCDYYARGCVAARKHGSAENDNTFFRR